MATENLNNVLNLSCKEFFQELDIDKSLKKVGLILAGGTGEKFWPLSNKKKSEHFVHLIGDSTLFQKTYSLISKQIDKDNIYIVSNCQFRSFIQDQISIKEENIINEPLMRQTAPALCLFLTLVEDKYDDNDIICVFPSDQFINRSVDFNFSINIACQAAAKLDALITIGVDPVEPNSHYGYIQYIEDITDIKNNKINETLYKNGVRKSINFVEKPDLETAQRFINSGGFVWNCGILVSKKKILVQTLKNTLKYHYDKFQYIKTLINTEKYWPELENLYKTFNNISIDYGILEKADNIYVVKSTFNWNDLNDWKDLHSISLKDAMNNVFHGDIIAIDTTDSLVISNQKPIAIFGMDDIVAIDTADAILICKKSQSHRLKDLVKHIQKLNIPI